jgi:hypothetical protein
VGMRWGVASRRRDLNGSAAGRLTASVMGVTFPGTDSRLAPTISAAPDRATTQAPAATAHMARDEPAEVSNRSGMRSGAERSSTTSMLEGDETGTPSQSLGAEFSPLRVSRARPGSEQGSHQRTVQPPARGTRQAGRPIRRLPRPQGPSRAPSGDPERAPTDVAPTDCRREAPWSVNHGASSRVAATHVSPSGGTPHEPGVPGVHMEEKRRPLLARFSCQAKGAARPRRPRGSSRNRKQ